VCGCEELSLFCRKDDVNKQAKERQNWFVRDTAFYPRRINGRLESSICRSTAVQPAELWAICTEYFDAYQRPSNHAIGRGIGSAQAIYDEGLGLHSDGIPHAYHANIIGWHDEAGKEPKEIKHHWMHAAQRIAAKFKFDPRPVPRA
jgi:hypothetical protein